jgi:putative peptidoglycan lipid II flippase
LIVIFGLGLSFVAAYISQRVIAYQFGTGLERDAFTAADTIPKLLFTMLGGGALAFAFIPVYTELLTKGRSRHGNKLFSNVVNSLVLLLGLLSILTFLLAPSLVEVIVPGYSPELQKLTTDLLRILLVSTVIFAVSSLVTGTLHSNQHFLLPALSPSMHSLGIIIGAIFFTPRFGIYGLAWGVVLGASLHLLIQVPGLIFFHVHWFPEFGWKNPALRRVGILMAPRIADLLLARMSIDLLNTRLGSGLGVGRVTALENGYSIMNYPWTLIGTAIGFAVFPTMSTFAAKKDIPAQRKALSGAIRAILTLAIPAAVALVLLGRTIIRVLFEGGEFTSESTELVYAALAFYSVALISQSVLGVVVRAFAAQKDTLTPLIISVFTFMLNVLLALWLSQPRESGGLEHGGIALANGLAVGLEAFIGLMILRRRWGGVDGLQIVQDLGRVVLASAAMAGAILALNNFLLLGDLVSLLLSAIIGALVYFGLAYTLGIQEVRTIPLGVLRSLRQPPASQAA